MTNVPTKRLYNSSLVNQIKKKHEKTINSIYNILTVTFYFYSISCLTYSGNKD